MAKSFVHRICGQSDIRGYYYRGADALDSPENGVWSQQIVKDVVEHHLRAPNAPIFFTGYSRGAAAIIDAAVQLKALGIVIEGMFLFDAVSRSPRLLGHAITNNVRHCYHAFRNPVSNSRKSFGNCGTLVEPGVSFNSAFFLTTHGGMGHNPWGNEGRALWPNREDIVPQAAIDAANGNPELQSVIFEGEPDFQFTTITLEQEIKGMDQVEVWMRANLATHGLKL